MHQRGSAELAVEEHAHRAAPAEHEVHLLGREVEPQAGVTSRRDQLRADAPLAPVGELVRLQRARRQVIDPELVRPDRPGREAGKPLVPEVRLRGHGGMRSRIGEPGRDGQRLAALAEQAPDPRLGRAVLPSRSGSNGGCPAGRSGTSPASTGSGTRSRWRSRCRARRGTSRRAGARRPARFPRRARTRTRACAHR